MPGRAFVYILRCADGSLYTGYTVDLERRIKQHQSGNGGRYTRTHLPVALIYSERCRTRRAAMRRELEIKRLSRGRKLALVAGVAEAGKQQRTSSGRTRSNRTGSARRPTSARPGEGRETKGKKLGDNSSAH